MGEMNPVQGPKNTQTGNSRQRMGISPLGLLM